MCDGIERILRKLGAQSRVTRNLIFARVLTVMKTRRDYSCRWSHMESESSSDAHGVSQVQCTWRFDARTNSRWWRIFVKVEFVRIMSNIIVQGRLQLDLVLDCV